jgi:hypothetical protein
VKALTSILFFLVSANSFASQVACDSVESYFETADVVFVGKVIERKNIEESNDGICWTAAQGENCGSKVATFQVNELLKGKESNITTVYAGDGCYCVNPYLKTGNEYVVFGITSGDKAVYKSMNACATSPLSEELLNQIRDAK